jgi:hypothetical protein
MNKEEAVEKSFKDFIRLLTAMILDTSRTDQNNSDEIEKAVEVIAYYKSPVLTSISVSYLLLVSAKLVSMFRNCGIEIDSFIEELSEAYLETFLFTKQAIQDISKLTGEEPFGDH